MAEHFKLRRVNEITGTFVLVIVAVLVAAVVWMGHSQRWFRSRVTLQIVLPDDCFYPRRLRERLLVRGLDGERQW